METGAGEEVVDRGDPGGSLTGARGVSSKEKERKEVGRVGIGHEALRWRERCGRGSVFL